MQKNKTKQFGFTLIETVVAVAIFSTFLMYTTLSMVNIMRMNERTNLLRKTENDTRYILESIVRDARYSNGKFSLYGDYQERSGHVYVKDGDDLEVYNTDLVAKNYTVTTYSLADKILTKGIVQYNLDGSNPITLQSPIALNDPTQDLIINGFALTVVFSPDFSLPPTLEIKIDSESAKGVITGKEEYKTKVHLESKVSPRNY